MNKIMGPKEIRIRDPLHNIIEFDTSKQLERTLWKVVQTRTFQRLRRVKQQGFSDLVYPGATHSRFAHSIGVFHTARRLIDLIERQRASKQEIHAHQALAAALVHDLGHGPFSHAFEEVGKRLSLKMANHEHVSDLLIREGEIAEILCELCSGFANDVADIVRQRKSDNAYQPVVSSQFDADRLDYMQRDRLMTGAQHAAIDLEWLLANLEIGKVPYGVDKELLGEIETFVLGPKALHAAEAFVLGLFQLYPTVYLHKTTRSAQKLCTELLCRIVALAKDNAVGKTGLTDTHPLILFAKSPDQVATVLELDDTVVWGALPLLATAADECIAKLACRLRDRKLYKCIDVRTKLGPKKPDELDASCVAIREKLTEQADKINVEMPRILIDEDGRSPYKSVSAEEPKKAPLNQIYIRMPDGTAGGKIVDLKECSDVVRSLETFKFFRVYVADEDEEAKKIVGQAIDGEKRT